MTRKRFYFILYPFFCYSYNKSMSSLFLQRYKSVSRVIVLFGVLAGLLFSCGEGIRLFPFPPEATPGKHSRWASGDAVGYQKNIHRFESQPENQRSKIERDNQHHYLPNVYGALYDAPFRRLSRARSASVLFNPRFLKSRLFSFCGAGRAPPARVLNFL